MQLELIENQAATGLCRQSIANALKRLEASGILKIARRLVRQVIDGVMVTRQASNLYSVHEPAEHADQLPVRNHGQRQFPRPGIGAFMKKLGLPWKHSRITLDNARHFGMRGSILEDGKMAFIKSRPVGYRSKSPHRSLLGLVASQAAAKYSNEPMASMRETPPATFLRLPAASCRFAAIRAAAAFGFLIKIPPFVPSGRQVTLFATAEKRGQRQLAWSQVYGIGGNLLFGFQKERSFAFETPIGGSSVRRIFSCSALSLQLTTSRQNPNKLGTHLVLLRPDRQQEKPFRLWSARRKIAASDSMLYLLSLNFQM